MITHAPTPTPTTVPSPVPPTAALGGRCDPSNPATHHAARPTHHSLPPLPPESRHLLTRFLALGHDAAALAAERAQDLFDILEKLAEPAITAWLAHIAALATNRRRELALQTLESICKTSPDLTEQRRAATRLLAQSRAIEADPRAIEVGSPGFAATGFPPSMRPTTPRPNPPSRNAPRINPLLTPNPTRSAEDTLRTMLTVIAEKSTSQEQSRRTIDTHCSQKAVLLGVTIEPDADDAVTQFENDPAFAPLHIIDRGVQFQLDPPTTNTPTLFEQTATFSNETSTHRLTFTLTPSGSDDPVWIIRKIQAPTLTAPP